MIRVICLFFVFALFQSVPAQAQSSEVAELRQRVVSRAPAITRLKSAGLVREGNNGLLESTTQLTEADTLVVQAENRDRTSGFSVIALNNNLPVSEVQRLFTGGARTSAAPPASSPTSAPSTPQSTPAAPTATPAPIATPAASPVPPPAASPTSSPSPAPPSAPRLPTSPILPPAEGLPAKVLNRPAVSLHESASDSSPVVRDNLPGFLVYYTLTESNGWMQVAASEGGAAVGWFRSADVIPWRHNLAVRFAHEGRGNRQPVAFFGTQPQLESVMRDDTARRKSIVESATGVPDRTAAESAGVVAVQPTLVARDQFYVLPILEHRAVTPRDFPMLQGEARLLRVAALKQSAGSAPAPTPAGSAGARPAMDIVFVTDLSSSMQPFVDETITAMRGLSDQLADGTVASAVRFGFWGYRDRKPDQDFGGNAVTKNFTPQLQDREAFLRTLQGVTVSSNSAGDYAEAVLYGVRDALQKTAWTPGAMRFVVLIGDASSHPPGHEKNPEKLSPGTVRALANSGERPSYILPIYIQRDSPLAADDARIAKAQFQELGQNPNVSGDGLFLQIQQGNSAATFGSEIKNALDQLVERLKGAADFESQKQSPGATAGNPTTTTGAGAATLADSIFAGAYLDWLASAPQQGTPVADSLAGWAVDKDLASPEVQALDVVFLITKSQLDTLVRLLNQVIDAGVRSRVRGTNFFSSLQSVVGRAAVDPSNLTAPDTLANAAMLPDFLRVLPYQSELLTLTQDEWRGMSAADQTAFLDRLNSNITYYAELSRDPSKWQPLNSEDNREAHVTAVPLDRLP